MANEEVQSRGLVVLGSILIQLSLGVIYAWSVFTPALKTAGWITTDMQIVFAAALVFYVIAMVWAGKQLTKMGPVNLAYAAAIVLGVAYILAGLVDATSFPVLSVTIGLFGLILGGLVGDMGNFTLAFFGCGILVLIGAEIMFLAKTPRKPEFA